MQMIKKSSRILWILIILLTAVLAAQCSGGGENVKYISPTQAHDLISSRGNDPDFKIIDIRTPGEFKSGHLKDAVLIDFYAKGFLDKIKQLNKTKTYLVYCRTGNRSGQMMRMIKDFGFHEIYLMDQGIRGWQRKNYSVIRN